MNRIVCLLLACVLLPLSFLNCYATGKIDTNDVFITVNYTQADGQYIATATDGVFTVTVDDGVVLTVKQSDANDNYSLVVYVVPESDTEAYKWFEGCTTYYGDLRKYYDIYFVDRSGNRVELDGCEVKLKVSDEYDEPKAAVLSKEGKLMDLDSTAEENVISFKTCSNVFYVLANSHVAKPDTPQTGDNNLAWPFVLIIIAMSGVILITGKNKLFADR